MIDLVFLINNLLGKEIDGAGNEIKGDFKET